MSLLTFVCNFVINQRILMLFSQLGLEMDDTCESMNSTHLN